MLEAAVPTIAFTVIFLTVHDLRLAIIVSVACAGVLLAIRLVQRSTPQFVLNALVGIGIGALFAWRAAKGGGDAGEQALAYFLPGLLYNLVYGAVMVFTIVIRWPRRRVHRGQRGRRPDRVAPGQARRPPVQPADLAPGTAVPRRVVVQGPIYLAGRNDWWSTDSAVAALGVAKLAMGWPLQVAALAAMVWVLSRNSIPIKPGEPEPHLQG